MNTLARYCKYILWNQKYLFSVLAEKVWIKVNKNGGSLWSDIPTVLTTKLNTLPTDKAIVNIAATLNDVSQLSDKQAPKMQHFGGRVHFGVQRLQFIAINSWLALTPCVW